MTKDEKQIITNALALFEEIKMNIDDTMLICPLGVWADDNEFIIDQTIEELKFLLGVD
jgi:hypothetical protein